MAKLPSPLFPPLFLCLAIILIATSSLQAGYVPEPCEKLAAKVKQLDKPIKGRYKEPTGNKRRAMRRDAKDKLRACKKRHR